MSAINSISPSASTSTAIDLLPQSRPNPQMPEASKAETASRDLKNAVDSKRLQEMVDRANKQLAGAGNQRLSFGYEERLNRLYVQIKDNATGEVVREIPPQKLIEQQAAMSEMIGIILDRNV